MKFKFDFLGITEADGEKNEMYAVNRTHVIVSRSNKSNELDKEIDGTVLRISFSNPKGKPPQDDIDYALNRFGFDVNKHYFSFMKESYNPLYNETKDIYFYEQIIGDEPVLN